MSLCRIYWLPDGSICDVVRPGSDGQLDGESDAAFYERVMAKRVAVYPYMADLPYLDMEWGALPDRNAPCENEDCQASEHVMRAMWRMQDGKVVIDHGAVNLPAIMQRIEAMIARLKLDYDPSGDVVDLQRELLRYDALLAQAQAAHRGDVPITQFHDRWERHLKAESERKANA